MLYLRTLKPLRKMSAQQERDIHIRVEMIIERSRHAEESFLIDTKAASRNIIDMLKKENLIVNEASVFQVEY